MKKLVLILSLLILPMLSHAQSGDENTLLSNVRDITQGVVIEGESLPIGITLGDSFQEIEAIIAAIQEFDLNERFCEGLICTYTARNTLNEELGQVRVGFRFDNDTVTFNASSMTWTFEDWTTSAGLSLRALRDEVSEEEVQALYPSGLTLFRDRNGRSSRAVSSFTIGILMASNVSPGRSSMFGRIF